MASNDHQPTAEQIDCTEDELATAKHELDIAFENIEDDLAAHGEIQARTHQQAVFALHAAKELLCESVD